MFPISASSNRFNACHGNTVFCGELASGSSVGSNCQDLISRQFSVVSSWLTWTPIVGLFLACSPATVLRTVIRSPLILSSVC